MDGVDRIGAARARRRLHDHRTQAVGVVVGSRLPHCLGHQEVVVAGTVGVNIGRRRPVAEIAGMDVGAVVEIVEGIARSPGHGLAYAPVSVVVDVGLRRLPVLGGADHPPQHVIAQSPRTAIAASLGRHRAVGVIAETACVGRAVGHPGSVECLVGLELLGGVEGVGVVGVVDVGVPRLVVEGVVAVRGI